MQWTGIDLQRSQTKTESQGIMGSAFCIQSQNSNKHLRGLNSKTWAMQLSTNSLVVKLEGRHGLSSITCTNPDWRKNRMCNIPALVCFRRVSASRRSGPESDPWQQHERLELQIPQQVPASWPAARDSRIGWLVSWDGQQYRVSADRHGSAAHCLRSSNAGARKIGIPDDTVQAVHVAWRGNLVVLSGEQRGQGNWALQRLSLCHAALHPF